MAVLTLRGNNRPLAVVAVRAKSLLRTAKSGLRGVLPHQDI